jgi:transcription-repair coupling factor (superfamily II helicase)
MYLKLLEETVQELKGETPALEVRTSMNLGLDVRIPTEYVGEEHQRLRAYRRIAEATEPEKAETILAELRDRYGPPPDAVADLVEFSLLKSLAERLGIESIDRGQGFLNLKFHPESRIEPARLMDLVRRAEGAQFTPAGVLRLPVAAGLKAGELLRHLKERLGGLGAVQAKRPAPRIQ